MKISAEIKFLIVAVLLIAAKAAPAHAQRIAVTSNAFEDVILTPNVGIDIVMSDRQSLSFDTSFAPYRISRSFHNKSMTFRAGYKYWFSQAFYAHYIGVDAVAASSEIALGRLSSKDEYVGIGVGYGYSFIIGKKVNLVPHVGIGVAYGKNYEGYDHMNGSQAVQAVATPGFRPILTRLGVTIQYILK